MQERGYDPAHAALGVVAPSHDQRKEDNMLKSGLAVIAALGLIAGAALAQQKMDCPAAYKNAVEKFHKEKAASLTGDKLAEAHRIALRAYDACTAGDEFNAQNLFSSLDRYSN
jgi:hypothetical protein